MFRIPCSQGLPISAHFVSLLPDYKKMHTIHFDHRTLVISGENEARPNVPDEIVCFEVPESGLPDIINELDNNANIARLTLLTGDEENKFRRLCANFTEINAGGGLVKNEKGEFLLIFRNGRWDLPKGKQETGEEIRLTAQREVGEECGITAPEAGKLICITNHTYHREGKFILKHTYWYEMNYRLSEKPAPQTSEGIEDIKWVNKEELVSCLDNSYPSIKEVFAKENYI